MRVRPQEKFVYLPAGLILGIGLSFALTTLANDSELDSGPRVFPYNGVLDLDGAPFTGQADFRFTLTDEEDCSFTENHQGVSVYNGRFGTNIGAVIGDVPACVFDAERVFIQMAVRSTNEGGAYKTLSGKQRIHPVPFAYWAAEGSDFVADGNITATLDISAGRNLSANNITANNTITSGGSITTGTDATVGNRVFIDGDRIVLGADAGRNRGSITSQRAMVHGNSNDSLILNFQGDFEGGTLIDSNTTVDGALTTTGNIAVQGDRVTINNKRALYRNNSNNILYLSPSNEFSEVRVQSPTRIQDDLTVDDNLTVSTNLRVDGTTSLYGNLTSNSLISTSGLIRGQLDIDTNTVTINSTTKSVDCDSGHKPISCGVGLPRNAGNQDAFGCSIDIGNGECDFWRRQNGSGAETPTGYCYCLEVGS